MDMKKLPDAEYELMRIIWANPSPISTNQIISHLDDIHWKPQTVLTLLTRLIDRGYLDSERVGKERVYTPKIAQEKYLAFESGQFMERFHAGSFISLVSSLTAGNRISQDDLDELRRWLAERGDPLDDA